MDEQQQESRRLPRPGNRCRLSWQRSGHQGEQEGDVQTLCSLQDLAMKVIVPFIANKIQRLIPIRFQSGNVPALFEELQIFLHQSIPVPVWEALVPRLTDPLLLTSAYISVTTDMLLTLHPLTKSLCNHWQLEVMRTLDTANKQDRYSKIQVLKLNIEVDDLLKEALPQFCNLEHFEVQRFCSDEIIAALALYCKKLKHLNVHGSIDVTNKSVSAILSLNSLKSLNIAKTAINVEGLDLLFTESINRRQENSIDILDLEYLEFSKGNTKNYEKLGSAFPHLKHLGVYFIHSSLEMLSSLQGLTSFLFYEGNFQHFSPLLCVIGKQFQHLHLEGVQELDLHLISVQCVVLKTITLKAIISIANLPAHFLSNIIIFDEARAKLLLNDRIEIIPEVIQKFIAQCSTLEKLDLV